MTPTYPSRSHFQCTMNRKGEPRIRMNGVAYQEKEQNENTGKKDAEEEKNSDRF